MSDTRWVTGAGLAAIATVVAHGGPAGLTDPRALALALTGAAVAALGLWATAGRVLDLHRRALAPRLDASRAAVPADVPFTVVVAVMLTLQGAAHVALLAAGVHAAGGAAAAPALHVVLALVAAVVVVAADRALQKALRTLESVLTALLELLVSAVPRPRPRPLALPSGNRRSGPPTGRAPPSGF